MDWGIEKETISERLGVTAIGRNFLNIDRSISGCGRRFVSDICDDEHTGAIGYYSGL